MLKLAEHDLAGAATQRQRAQVVAVEAVHPRAQRVALERRRRLLDRSGKDDVETDDAGAAIDERAQHRCDFRRPGDARRPFERRRVEGLLVDRDHDRGRAFRRECIAENAPAQCGKNIDRQAAQRIECRRGGNKRRDEDDQERCECGAQPSCVHEVQRDTAAKSRAALKLLLVAVMDPSYSNRFT